MGERRVDPQPQTPDDLAEIEERQQRAWASGDHAVLGTARRTSRVAYNRWGDETMVISGDYPEVAEIGR